MSEAPNSYRDPFWVGLAAGTEQKLGLPRGLLETVLLHGERSNASQVSEAGAKTPFQITPSTRKAVMERDGIDAYLSPENAAEVAGLVLKDGLNWAQRSTQDPDLAAKLAAGFYHAGGDRANWGARTNAYVARVGSQLDAARDKALNNDFAKWMAANPASGPTAAATAGMSPTQSAMAQDFGAWAAGAGQIPGTPTPERAPVSQLRPAAAPAEPGMVDQAIGTGEAALSTATGMTGGTLGMIGGTLKGLAEQILSGQFGTKQAADMVEKSAMEGAQAGTYAPRTPSGQQQTAAVGDFMNNVLMPIAGVAHTMPPMGAPNAGPAGVLARAGVEGTARDVAGAIARPAELAGMVAPGVAGEAAAGMAGAGLDAAAKVASMAKGVTTLPRRALEALRSDPAATPGTMGSVGAAGTDMATMRRASAADLPVPIQLTKGQASRDPAQLKFEVETAKNPELGAPLRQRLNETNQAILENFDHWADQTGAQAPTLRATGSAVDQALVKQANAAKAEIKAKYAAARAAGEMEAPVSLTALVDHLNKAAPEATTAPLLVTARKLAIDLGIAEDKGGALVPVGSKPGPYSTLMNSKPEPGVTLNTAEQFRQAINRNTDYEATNIRQATIIKGLVDEATAGKGGDLYKAARQARMRYAQNFEDRAVIAKLLNDKKGMADRQVALEDVHKHAILDGSLDDVRNVRRVLQAGGAEGQQAWRELQGATLNYIRGKATESVALDAQGRRVVSPAGLDKAIRALDTDGKLDFIFGKKGAQQLRDIRELAQIAKTVPPEAAINYSNTAATLLYGAGDVALSGLSGVPAPLMTMGRLGLKHIKDQGLRKRINEALNEQAAKQAPGRIRFKATPVDPTPSGTPPNTVH